MNFETLDFLKLILGLAAFVFIAWIGGSNKRVGGVLLTFPVLNGVALLTSSAPFAVANTIFAVVILNAMLFWAAVTWIEWLPPLPPRAPEILRLLARLAVWAIIWGAVAYLLTRYREWLPSGAPLFVIVLCLAAAYIYFLWRAPPAPVRAASAPSDLEYWINWAIRVVLFVLVFAGLLFTAKSDLDPRWTGMASALPLPGLFALAFLSTRNDKTGLKPFRDTVLLGPLLVIPFNYLFAHVVVRLPAGTLGTIAGMLFLLVAWGLSLALVFWLIPRLAQQLDARRPHP